MVHQASSATKQENRPWPSDNLLLGVLRLEGTFNKAAPAPTIRATFTALLHALAGA
jgi:hypothetical protein